MIHSIPKTNLDEAHLENRQSPPIYAADMDDYRNLIVKKPWGYEYLVFENDLVSIWLLFIAKKSKTSMHCHLAKKTGLLLLSGQAILHSAQGSLHLSPYDSANISPCAFHATEARGPLPLNAMSENGIWVLEIESPPQKTDLFRLSDDFGRAGTAYEDASLQHRKPEGCLNFSMPRTNRAVRQRFLKNEFIYGNARACRRVIHDLGHPVGAVVTVVGRKQALLSPDGPAVGEFQPVDPFFDRLPPLDLDMLEVLVVTAKGLNHDNPMRQGLKRT